MVTRPPDSARGETTTVPFRFDDPDAYVHGTPYDALARLRRDRPFAWHRSSISPDEGFWLVLRHDDVVAISKNPRLFATKAPLLADPLPRELWPAFPALAMIADNLMTYGHEKHAVFRPIANSLLGTGRLAGAESRIRAACADVLDRAAERQSFDFADDVALPVPVHVVLGAFMGVPPEDLATVTRTVLTINAMDDPVFRPDGEALMRAAEELCAYGLGLLRRVAARPGDDILSELVHGRRLDGVSTEELFLAYWFPLAAGAFDTTASTIAGGIRALIEHPGQLRRLRADPALVPTAVEEIVRWVSPVVYFRRTSTEDVTFKGHRVGRGQKIVLCYASANRDEEVFADAAAFDVARTPNNHLSFGRGPHFCVGARLSGLILRIFLEEFLRRMPDLAIDGEVIHTRSCWMNRIRVMPVRACHASACRPSGTLRPAAVNPVR